MRLLVRGVRLTILAVFAVFFVAPLLWLVLAPTKSDSELVSRLALLQRDYPAARLRAVPCPK